MNNRTRTILTSAAMTGLLSGTLLTVGCGSDRGDMAGKDTKTAVVGKHDCAGKNACKGQGGCKSAKNDCKGKNACKGQGGCAVK